MLTVTPTNLDEGSSLGHGSTGSRGTDDVDCISEGSLVNEAEWRVVTAEGLDTQGVLILEGEEMASPTPNNNGNTGSNDGLTLSVPGTDSVPTIVGSIDGLPVATTSTMAPSSSPTDLQQNHENRASTGTSTGTTTGTGTEATTQTTPTLTQQATTQTQTTSAPTSSSKSRLAHFLVPTAVAALFLVPTMASVRFYGTIQQLQEEHQILQAQHFNLQSKKLDLEVKLILMTDEKNQLQTDVNELEQDLLDVEGEKCDLMVEVATLQDKVTTLELEAERKRQEEALRWDNCHAKAENVVLVDNCWLSAKANVQLGECANDAKEAVKNISLSLLERLDDLAHVWGNSSMAGSSWANAFDPFSDDDEPSSSSTRTPPKTEESVTDLMMRKMDLLGKALWWNTTAGSGASNNNEKQHHKNDSAKATGTDEEFITSFFSKMEANGKSWLKESIFTLFASDDDGDKTQKPPKQQQHQQPPVEVDLEDVLSGISDFVAAAGTFSKVAGEAFMAAAMEKAMEFNHTSGGSMNQWVDLAKQALDEASLARAGM